MSGKKADLEITLESIEIRPEAGFKNQSKRLVDFKLVWPRLSIAQKTASRTLKFADGSWNGKGKSWTERILFKETMQNTSGLEVTISDALADDDMEAMSRVAASSLIKLIGEAAADASGVKALEPFAEIPFSTLAKSIGSSKAAKTIASAAFDIDVSAYAALEPGDKVEVQIDLISSFDIAKTTRRSTKGSESTSKKLLFKEGDKIGTVTIAIKAI